MELRKLKELNKKQREDIRELVDECLKADGLEKKPYLYPDMNFYEDLDSFFLLYDNRRLVSVLTIFAPEEKEAEISAYTLPKERGKGYCGSLLKQAEKELLSFQIRQILFVLEPESTAGLRMIQAHQGVYLKSEYLLKRIHPGLRVCLINACDGPRKISEKESLNLRELEKKEIMKAAGLNALIFTGGEEAGLDFNEIYEAEEMQCYCFYKEKELIGIGNVSYGKKNACIFGLGIAPEYQGKGYGRELLDRLLSRIWEITSNDIILQAGSQNPAACALYKSAGFIVCTQYDYYRYEIPEIN